MSDTPTSMLDKRQLTRLLGDYAATGGPSALLGLTPAPTTRGQIEAALQRQLDRLQQHPETDTLAADQARVMLHEAATALLNTKRQSELLAAEQRKFTAPPATARAAAADHEQLARQRRERIGDPFVARALLVAVGFIIVMIVAVVVGAMFTSGGGGGNAKPPAPNTAAAPAATSTSAPSPSAASTPAPVTTPAESTAPSTAAAPTPKTDAAWSPRIRAQFVDPALVIRELRAAADTAKADPDKALVEFERTFTLAGDWWCRFDNAQVRAAGDAVAEFMYRVGSRRERADRVLAIIDGPTRALHPAPGMTIGPDDVWPAAWSAGILARFYRERDLPLGVASQVAQAVDRALAEARPTRSNESTFEAGALAALRQLPKAILFGRPRGLGAAADPAGADTHASLARWVEGVTLYCRDDELERERLLTGALGWLLTSAPEPEADARVFNAINLLAVEIKWRVGGSARPALIEWFRDPRIGMSDLRVLTAALASRSAAEGVDSTMAVPMSAKPDDRAVMRDRYARAWGLAEASARADSGRAFLAEASAALAVEPSAKDPATQLAFAAAYARLSTAAAVIWRGGSPDAPIVWQAPVTSASDPAIVNDPNSGLTRFSIGVPNSGSAAATGNGQDGIWTQEYLSEKHSIPGRIQRLEELSARGRPIGPIDSGLLRKAAAAESPWKVREQAQLVLRAFAEEPALIAAMLDFLPIAPRTADVSRLYADVSGVSLPAPADPRWELEARRAVLSRLMSMLTASGMYGDIETATTDIARAYLAAVGRKLSAASPPADEVADGAASAILELANQLAREAASSPVSGSMKFSLDAIERRRTQRRVQASGPVQAFAAEQSGLLELLAYVVAMDRPASEVVVAQALDDAAAKRRKAAHVFEQLLANERAMLRLWLLRFGEETKP